LTAVNRRNIAPLTGQSPIIYIREKFNVIYFILEVTNLKICMLLNSSQKPHIKMNNCIFDVTFLAISAKMRSFITCTLRQVRIINDQIKEDEMDRACSTNGTKRNLYRILVGKPKGKKPPGRPRCRWLDNIKMDVRELRWGCMNWIDLFQDRRGGLL
jgi:hypothetical protein